MEEFGCWQEAQRCDRVATELLRIRQSTELEFYDPITILLREVETTSRLLRDLHDLFRIYRTRSPIVHYYLTLILPCLQKTLRDMMIYVGHESLPAPRQWSLMAERLSDQGGMGLAPRFVMYIEFLIQCLASLRPDFPRVAPDEDIAIASSQRNSRYAIDFRSILVGKPREMDAMDQSLTPFVVLAPPVSVEPHFARPTPSPNEIERRHWAEKIFDEHPNSSTGMKHKRGSRCFGPPMVEERLGISTGSTVLFKHPFDKNRLSITLYLHPEGSDVTRLLCRWMDPYYNPLYSSYGVHELCVRRQGSSLQFRRWSNNKAHSTLWMALFFKTFEKMVLFHTAFVTLKARCPLTISVNPDDYKLAGEKTLFRGKIVDDGFEHMLTVYQDERYHVIRLHAAVLSGELKRCPVWTAFVSHESEDREWVYRRSRHRIWVKKLQPFVFCEKYRKKRQIQKNGEFEIYFAEAKAADAFEDLFMEEDSDSTSAVPGP